MRISHHVDFLVAVITVIVIGILSYLVFNRILRVNFFLADLRFSHWLSIVGTIGIAIATPLFTLLKRRYHANYSRLARFHIFGNLIFFGLIVFHFATQVARPASNFPELGSGLAMFIAMGVQIFFGFTQRFRSRRRLYSRVFEPKANRFLHASLVMVFYFIIVFHFLHGLGIL